MTGAPEILSTFGHVFETFLDFINRCHVSPDLHRNCGDRSGLCGKKPSFDGVVKLPNISWEGVCCERIERGGAEYFGGFLRRVQAIQEMLRQDGYVFSSVAQG